MYPTPPRNPRDDRPAPKARLSRADADSRLRMRSPSPPQPVVRPGAIRPVVTPTPSVAAPLSTSHNQPVPAQAQPVPAQINPPVPYTQPETAVASGSQQRLSLLSIKATMLPLKKVGLGFAGFAILAGIGLGALHFLGGAGQSAIVPKATMAKVTYGVFEPQKDKVLQVDKDSVEFDEKNKIITYSAVTNDQTKLIFSEQPTPESFVDVPQAFDKLISSLQGYTSFDSVNGKVNLTHPKELKGQQAAVLNNKGTLMFIRATGNVSDDTWRQIFNNLDVVK